MMMLFFIFFDFLWFLTGTGSEFPVFWGRGWTWLFCLTFVTSMSVFRHTPPTLIFLGMRTEHKYKLLRFFILWLFVSVCSLSWLNTKWPQEKVKQITTTPTEKHNKVISLSWILNQFTKALKTSSLNYNYAQLALQQRTSETTIPGTPASEHSAKANTWSCDSTHFLRCCLYSQSIKNAILAAFHVCVEIHW